MSFMTCNSTGCETPVLVGTTVFYGPLLGCLQRYVEKKKKSWERQSKIEKMDTFI